MEQRVPIRCRQGMTLLETVIGVAIIAIIAFSIYQGYSVLIRILGTSTMTVAVTTIANQEMELIRNMPYGQVGVTGGIPAGVIPAIQSRSRNNLAFSLVTNVRNVDDPFDGTATTTPLDTAPADYKLVEFILTCLNCGEAPSFRFTGRVAPKNLESSSVNGSLFIQAIDANGQPVSGARVQIVNNGTTPPININDPGIVTTADGFLRLVDVPPALQSYELTVLKPGYSTDRTYATSTANPNPVTSHATVAAQTVTQVSFAIDRVSTLNVSSVGETCSSTPAVLFTLTGAKLIGSSPDVPKFDQSYTTDSDGLKTVSNLEWDSYRMAISSPTHALAGTIPNLPLNIAPNALQDFKAVMRPGNPNALLATVRDAASGLPLSGASVTLSKTGYTSTQITGRGFLRQSDWSGGDGQESFVDPLRYATDDGNVGVAGPAGEVRLKLIATSTYAGSGILTSSTFDTGSASNFYDLLFQPTSQPPETGADAVRFQFAATSTPNPVAWDFRGPDGTAGSYYTSGNTSVSALHNGNRYFRYQLSLQTASTSFTPNVSDVAATFASACVPPGQVLFDGLPADTYTLTVTKSGYAPSGENVTTGVPWQERVILLAP